MSEHRRTFILGVGCQKGGTSWLSKYLRSHSAVKLGRLREYHVFDTLYMESCGNWYLDAVKNRKKDENYRLRAQFIENTESYFDYLERQMELSGKQVTADITPSYAGLPEYALKEIKQGFEKRGIQVKVIFLMRDPFERVYSYCKKGIRNSRKRQMKKQYIEQETLLKIYSTHGCEFRTRYDNTMKTLEKVFDSKDIFYAFYEEFFTDESIKKLTDFIGIPFERGNYATIVNKGQNLHSFDKTAYKKIIVNYYRDTYKFIFEKFGEEYVRSLWKSSEYLAD